MEETIVKPKKYKRAIIGGVLGAVFYPIIILFSLGVLPEYFHSIILLTYFVFPIILIWGIIGTVKKLKPIKVASDSCIKVTKTFNTIFIILWGWYLAVSWAFSMGCDGGCSTEFSLFINYLLLNDVVIVVSIICTLIFRRKQFYRMALFSSFFPALFLLFGYVVSYLIA